jgi:transglutaminase-like putative cysteine protease
LDVANHLNILYNICISRRHIVCPFQNIKEYPSPAGLLILDAPHSTVRRFIMQVHGVTTRAITDLLPIRDPWNVTDPRKKESVADEIYRALLQDIHEIRMKWISLKMAGVGETVAQKNVYGEYLDFPNTGIRAVADSIVEPGDTNDQKAFKIMLWVQENIAYVSDLKNYGRPEYWARPSQTIQKGSGDCEDGAFLIHSLMLNADIPWERIRTYGGLVES